MLKIIYGKNGEPISDFEVYKSVDATIDAYKIYSKAITEDFVVQTCNELYFLTFGLRVLEEKIPIDEIEFYFEDEKLDFHPVLGIVDPKNEPLGFFTEVSNKAVKIGYEKLKTKRDNND